MRRLTCVPLFLFLVCLFGCGSGGSKLPPLAKVSGKVTLDGNPMGGGEVRFHAVGQPAKVLEVKDGAFSGEVFSGKNTVDVIWDKEGNKPHPMDPSKKIPENVVDAKFSGPSTPFTPEIPTGGTSDLTFAVTSARK
jgi:hypothetical protein